MPGLSVTVGCSNLDRDATLRSISELKHDCIEEVIKYIESNKTLLCFSKYNGYPSYFFENDEFFLLLEGLIYNKSEAEINQLLVQIIHEYLKNNSTSFRKKISEFIEAADGDFIGVIVIKSHNRVLIFNDRWARLPAFFFYDNNVFAFSREIKFLFHWIPIIEFDKIAMAEFLIYQYNLGEKTFFKNINRLKPATILEINYSTNIGVLEDNILPVDFTTNDNLNRDEIIDKCITLFKESIASRINKANEKGLQIMADLSGGYDSRAVFGGLCLMGADLVCCTDALATGNESHIAKQVSKLYNREIFEFSAIHPLDNINILNKVTYLLDCTQNSWTAVSTYYDSLERKKRFTKPTAHFMGFGGEFIRHPYHKKKPYKNLISALEDAAFSNCLSAPTALSITQVKKTEFSQKLREEIAKFPERNEEDKIKHLYFEYYNKLVNGGEDRHRLFSWTMQPLWGKDLFTFEMQNISRKKIGFRFFIDFLKCLDSKLLEPPIYGSRLKLNSIVQVNIYLVKMRLREILINNRHIFNCYKKMARKIHKKEEVSIREIQRLCKNPFLSKQLDISSIEDFLNHSPRRYEAYQLLTLMTYVAEVHKRFGSKVQLNATQEVKMPIN